MALSFVCERLPVLQTCVVCGSEFSYVPVGKVGRPRRLCGDKCRDYRRHEHRLKQEEHPFQCENCGKQGVAAKKHGRQFCSQACAKASTRIYPTRSAQKVAYEKRRRARLRTSDVEHFSDREIFERDRWRCGICHKTVDRRLKFPDWMAPSIDHTVPLSEGGTHTRRNVQCAHWICNSRKTNGAGGQLRLFG